MERKQRNQGMASLAATRNLPWLALAFLLLLNVIDFVARQVVVAILPVFKTLWSVSDSQLGSLVSIVPFTVAICSIPIAVIADRWDRVKMITAMALVWSIATLACTFATDYRFLLTARAIVGVGEAGYGPVGAALLTSLFPLNLRARVLASFGAASAIGSVGGIIGGGIVSQAWGWQWAFAVVGIAGIVVAVLFVACVRNTRPVDAKATKRLKFHDTVIALSEAPSAILIHIGYAIQLIVVSTVYAWLPSFLNRYYEFTIDVAGMWSGAILVLSSISAIFWGVLADRTGRHNGRNKFWVVAGTSIGSSVMLMISFGLLSPGPAQVCCIVIGTALMTGPIGTVTAIALDAANPSVSATTIAIGYFLSNIFGMAVGPMLSGSLSDIYGLTYALTMISSLGTLAAIVTITLLPLYDRDVARLQ